MKPSEQRHVDDNSAYTETSSMSEVVEYINTLESLIYSLTPVYPLEPKYTQIYEEICEDCSERLKLDVETIDVPIQHVQAVRAFLLRHLED